MFNIAWCGGHTFTKLPEGGYHMGPPRDAWKLRQYLGSGSASVVESNQTWSTKEEAQAAADRANAGDKGGLTFSLYADD